MIGNKIIKKKQRKRTRKILTKAFKKKGSQIKEETMSNDQFLNIILNSCKKVAIRDEKHLIVLNKVLYHIKK